MVVVEQLLGLLIRNEWKQDYKAPLIKIFAVVVILDYPNALYIVPAYLGKESPAKKQPKFQLVEAQ